LRFHPRLLSVATRSGVPPHGVDSLGEGKQRIEFPKRRYSPPVGCTSNDFVSQHCTTPCAQNPHNVPGHLNKLGCSARSRILLSQRCWGAARMPCANSDCCAAFAVFLCPVKPDRGREKKTGFSAHDRMLKSADS